MLRARIRFQDYNTGMPLPCNDIYNTPEYYKLYEWLGDGLPTVFCFKKNRKQAFYPFLLNSVNRLGFDLDDNYYDIQSVYGYGGVISNSYEPSFIDAFYRNFHKYCKKNNIIAEFIRFHPFLGNEKFSKDDVNVSFNRKTVYVDLTKKYEDIWDNEYTRKNRNRIRKAKSQGYLVEISGNPEHRDIISFIDLYEYTMMKVNADAYYFFRADYFHNIFEILKGHAYLISVKKPEGDTLCSCIFLHYKDYFHYHLLGRSAEADHTVNSYLLDQAIIFGQDLGAKYLHLGGGNSDDETDSLFRFKKEFSNWTRNFHIGKKVHNQDVYDKVVRQWTEKYPEKIEKHGCKILKYRY